MDREDAKSQADEATLEECLKKAHMLNYAGYHDNEDCAYVHSLADRVDGILAHVTRMTEMLVWALKQNYYLDKSNATVHTAAVRYSPLTFRLAEVVADSQFLDMTDPDGEAVHILAEVLAHVGTYAEDPGR